MPKLHCDQCNTRRDSKGTVHYYHSAITPVIIRPAGEFVLSLPPEFIVPQDGHEKQDCEQAAIKRWLATHTTELKAWSRTYLGDDLYAKGMVQKPGQLALHFYVNVLFFYGKTTADLERSGLFFHPFISQSVVVMGAECKGNLNHATPNILYAP